MAHVRFAAAGLGLENDDAWEAYESYVIATLEQECDFDLSIESDRYGLTNEYVGAREECERFRALLVSCRQSASGRIYEIQFRTQTGGAPAGELDTWTDHYARIVEVTDLGCGREHRDAIWESAGCRTREQARKRAQAHIDSMRLGAAVTL